MKKNDNQGFVLAETLIVATVVLAALVFVYSQFRTVNQSYNRTFRYNTVEGLYATDNIRTYLLNDGMDVLKLLFNNDSSRYVDITSCPSVYMMNSNYCKELLKVLDVKHVFLTKAKIEKVKSLVNGNNSFSEEMKLFVNYTSDVHSSGYRLWVEFNNGTFATLHIDNSMLNSEDESVDESE